jgi:hypothetical protein
MDIEKVGLIIFTSILRLMDVDDSNLLNTYAAQQGIYTHRFGKNVEPVEVLEDSSRTRKFLKIQIVFSIEPLGVLTLSLSLIA